MSVRLHKLLAGRGIASRREAEALVAAGRVAVNGIAAHVGQQVEESDDISVDGVLIPPPSHAVYLALNKPPGVVTTLRPRPGERTVLDLLPAELRMHPVGRLDKDTSGLLLFSNDGEWSNLVTHPRYRIEKEYDVLVRGCPGPEAVEQMRLGIEIEPGVVTAPARVRRLSSGPDRARISVTVMEGKKRQIRLMAAAVGHPVLALRRVRIGAIRLGDLPEGHWRRLRREEVESIRDHARRATRGGSPSSAHNRDRRPRRRG
jgi:23S rRNA pseudouridine2605 synthase